VRLLGWIHSFMERIMRLRLLGNENAARPKILDSFIYSPHFTYIEIVVPSNTKFLYIMNMMYHAETLGLNPSGDHYLFSR
jgi:hypothetical protein